MTEAIVNGHNGNQPISNDVPTFEIPLAKLNKIKISDYTRESLDKVAVAEGFKNYDLLVDHGARIGDGFVGQILKVWIKEIGHDKSMSVLAKIPPDNKSRRELHGTMKLFEREVYAYNVFLQELVEFQRDKNISEANGFYNFPKVYFAEYNKEKQDSIIIMQDLRDSGHKMLEKSKPINYEHAKLLLVAIGRLHALSFAMKAQRPEQFEKFKAMDDFTTNNSVDEAFVIIMKNAMMKAVDSLDKNDIKRRTRVLNLAENLVDTLKFAMNPENSEPFTVITHGDCWFNNFMYFYEKKDLPKSMVLLDWQITRYVSPVIDFVYFMFMCTDHHLRAKHFDEFLNIYYNSLKEMLERLGGDIMIQFPFTTLLRQLRKFGRVAIIFSSMAIPMFQTRNEDLPDMDFMADQLNDPTMVEEMLRQYVKITNKNADKINERIRGVLHDAIRYGYL